MYDLIRQAQDPDQICGRANRIRIVRFRSGDLGIQYVTPNRREFVIDTKNGSPNVFSRWPIEEGLPGGHSTHYFGEGRICLGNNMSNLQLYELLYMIDAWARGYEIYQKTGHFPANPREVFPHRGRQGSSQGGSIWESIRRMVQ